MNDMHNARFADYATSIAFNVTLSKPQVVTLCDIANKAGHTYYMALGMRSTEVQSIGILKRRGLIYAPDENWPGICELTEAGKNIFALLEIAGIAARIDKEVKAA
jgi:hypothetical protein